MPVWIKANESNAIRRRIYFDLRLASDGVSPATEEAGSNPQISLSGGGWTSTGVSTLTHIGHGRYYAELTLASVGNAGDRIESRYKSSNTVETSGDIVQVVAFDPFDGNRLGLAAFPNSIPGVFGGLPVLNSSGNVTADLAAIAGSDLTESVSASLANNFTQFFDVDPVSTQSINDIGGGGGASWSTTEKEQIRHRLGIDGAAQPASANPSLATASDMATVVVTTAAIKSKTDQLAFSSPGLVDARIEAVGETGVSSPTDLMATQVTVTGWSAGAIAELFTVDSGESFATSVPGSVVAEIVANAGGASAAAIANAVWNAEPDQFDEPDTMGQAVGQAVRMGIEATVADAGATASVFRGDNTLSPAPDYYVAGLLVFLDGANQGCARPIAGYSGSLRAFSFSHPFPAAPADGDRFRITGYAPSV